MYALFWLYSCIAPAFAHRPCPDPARPDAGRNRAPNRRYRCPAGCRILPRRAHRARKRAVAEITQRRIARARTRARAKDRSTLSPAFMFACLVVSVSQTSRRRQTIFQRIHHRPAVIVHRFIRLPALLVLAAALCNSTMDSFSAECPILSLRTSPQSPETAVDSELAWPTGSVAPASATCDEYRVRSPTPSARDRFVRQSRASSSSSSSFHSIHSIILFILQINDRTFANSCVPIPRGSSLAPWRVVDGPTRTRCSFPASARRLARVPPRR